MKPGDIIKFKPHKCKDWGTYALVYDVISVGNGLGTVRLINSVLPAATIPWLNRHVFAEVVIES